MKYVLVNQNKSGMTCHGIFDSYHEAVGFCMEQLWTEEDWYNNLDDTESGKKWDKYEYTKPYALDNDSGWKIDVTFKSSDMKEEEKSTFWILESAEKDD